MSGLVLKLGPRERVLINGAVIENGDRRSRLSIVTPNANILRLRDAIHPDEARTPVRRLCFTTQLVLTGDAAHINNPLGGMGMNGGIHDSFNLAEKLIPVLKGKADPAILDNYSDARRNIAMQYVQKISIENMFFHSVHEA